MSPTVTGASPPGRSLPAKKMTTGDKNVLTAGFHALGRLSGRHEGGAAFPADPFHGLIGGFLAPDFLHGRNTAPRRRPFRGRPVAQASGLQPGKNEGMAPMPIARQPLAPTG